VGDSRAYVVSGGGDTSVRATPSPVDSGAATVILKRPDGLAENPPYGGIRRLTEDHSVVMGLVKAGVITEEDIRSHPLRNRITRCIGSSGAQEPDFRWYDLRNGDVLILCSDGLWEMVHEDLILAVVKSSRTPEEMCAKLVGAANDAGGHDNITVIAAMFTG
jgi:protein phosphatase